MVLHARQELPNAEPSRGARAEADELLQQLRDAKDLPARKELVSALYTRLEAWLSECGTKLSSEVQKIYHAMSRELPSDLLVRQESLDVVAKVLVENMLHELLPTRDGVTYANAACFGAQGEGLDIAFSEGRAGRGGFVALLGFNPRGLDVKEVPPPQCDLRDRTMCRSVTGSMTRDRVKYIVVRIPRNLFPEDRLTPEELERDVGYIFRATSLQ